MQEAEKFGCQRVPRNFRDTVLCILAAWDFETFIRPL